MSYPLKATDSQLVISYSHTKSVWKTAAKFGMCGQSVHDRLSKLGVVTPQRVISESERNRIREVYTAGFLRGDGALESLAAELKMDVTNVCREARRLGLTNKSRIVTDELAALNGKRVAARWKANGHPRGMLGTELNLDYWKDSIGYMEMAEREVDVPTLFDLLETNAAKNDEAAA